MTQTESAALRDRVVELETRLRRIAAELRAAGFLDPDDLPGGGAEARLSELTPRQREVLERILKGQRVPAIASELFVSPSTVRNHLATIFRRFGVHSQSELIELMSGKRWPPEAPPQGIRAAES